MVFYLFFFFFYFWYFFYFLYFFNFMNLIYSTKFLFVLFYLVMDTFSFLRIQPFFHSHHPILLVLFFPVIIFLPLKISPLMDVSTLSYVPLPVILLLLFFYTTIYIYFALNRWTRLYFRDYLYVCFWLKIVNI